MAHCSLEPSMPVFESLITLDDDIELEQNMEGRKIAILVIKAGEQCKAPIKAMAGRVLVAHKTLTPGEIRMVNDRDD